MKLGTGANGWRYFVGLLAAASLVTVACTDPDAERLDLVLEVLAERATHLPGGTRGEIAGAVLRSEKANGVDVFLTLALIEEESHFRPAARSRAGAIGLTQVRPRTAAAVAKREGIPWRGETSLLDPVLNVRIGTAYLARQHERFGSWDLALTAYNRGPTRARRIAASGRQPSSKYAGRVLRRAAALRDAAGVDG